MSGKKDRGPIRACLITSPRSGEGGLDLDDVLPVLRAQGWEVAIREKQEKGEAVDLARKAADDGYDPVVNCGGDGTLNEIVEALTGTEVAVGTIPGGTANVWSKQVHIAQRPRVAATQLVASERVRVDVGRLEMGKDHASHFLMMAGLGADGEVMDRVSRTLKNRVGSLAVGVAAVEALPSLKVVPVHVELDGVHWDGKVGQIIVGNTRQYGGFTRITNEAHMDDGLLDVCLFTTQGVLATGRQITSMLVRRRPSPSSAEQYRAARIVIDAPVPLPLQLDGSAVHQQEKGGEHHYEFTVVPRGLTVLVPRTYDGDLFQRHPESVEERAGKGKKGKKHKKS